MNLDNIKMEPCKVLLNGTDVGYTEGDLELGFEENLKEITAHQHGTNVLGALVTGKKISDIKLVMKETALTQLQDWVKKQGTLATAVAEVSTIVTTADVSKSLQNKYFYLNSANDAIEYYVWLNVNSEGADPLIAGKTAIPVSIATNATAAAVATAIASAIDALAGFVSSASSSTVTVTNAATGGTTDLSDGNSGFTLAVTTQGLDAVPGWGMTNDFSAAHSLAVPLTLHPVVLSASDQSRDWHFWKAYPMMNSLKPSGENEQLIEISFKIFPDLTRATAVQYFVLGAHK